MLSFRFVGIRAFSIRTWTLAIKTKIHVINAELIFLGKGAYYLIRPIKSSWSLHFFQIGVFSLSSLNQALIFVACGLCSFRFGPFTSFSPCCPGSVRLSSFCVVSRCVSVRFVSCDAVLFRLMFRSVVGYGYSDGFADRVVGIGQWLTYPRPSSAGLSGTRAATRACSSSRRAPSYGSTSRARWGLEPEPHRCRLACTRARHMHAGFLALAPHIWTAVYVCWCIYISIYARRPGFQTTHTFLARKVRWIRLYTKLSIDQSREHSYRSF